MFVGKREVKNWQMQNVYQSTETIRPIFKKIVKHSAAWEMLRRNRVSSYTDSRLLQILHFIQSPTEYVNQTAASSSSLSP